MKVTSRCVLSFGRASSFSLYAFNGKAKLYQQVQVLLKMVGVRAYSSNIYSTLLLEGSVLCERLALVHMPALVPTAPRTCHSRPFATLDCPTLSRFTPVSAAERSSFACLCRSK
jgi:hypothetical protein